MAARPVVHIYTDGGCAPNPGVGAWAAVLISPAHDHRREISGAEPRSTNNRMELLAAIKALGALKRPCNIRFHTDSRYLRDAFEKGWIDKWRRNGWKTKAKKDVLNVDLWHELLDAQEPHDVSWVWVKGHAYNVENNRCDELVARARDALLSSGAKKR